MTTQLTMNMSGGFESMLSGFGQQIETRMKSVLMNVCKDLGIERKLFEKTWNKYSKETGITLGTEKSQDDDIPVQKTEEKDAPKSVPNAYQMYVKMWREARDRGEDNRTFADVRRDWKELPEEEKETMRNQAISHIPPPPPPVESDESDGEDIPYMDDKKLIPEKWKVSELKNACRACCLPVSGTKKVLIQRLIDFHDGVDDVPYSHEDSYEDSDEEGSYYDSSSEDESVCNIVGIE